MATGVPPTGVLPSLFPVSAPQNGKGFAVESAATNTSYAKVTSDFDSLGFYDKPLSIKPFQIVEGDPYIQWTSKEIHEAIEDQLLQFTVIATFSGAPNFQEVKQVVASQVHVTRQCIVGSLDPKHILLRLSNKFDYANLLSSSWIINTRTGKYPMKIIKWTPWFSPNFDTSIMAAWISFPGLDPHLFSRNSLFLFASVVGVPLMVDKATCSKSRPSCARVKVELDLLEAWPSRINISCKDSKTSSIKEKWKPIRYELYPLFCSTCQLQGHDKESCRRGNSSRKSDLQKQNALCQVVIPQSSALSPSPRSAKVIYPNEKNPHLGWTVVGPSDKAKKSGASRGATVLVSGATAGAMPIPVQNSFTTLSLVEVQQPTQHTVQMDKHPAVPAMFDSLAVISKPADDCTAMSLTLKKSVFMNNDTGV